MGKLQHRLTITVSGQLIGWRKLHPEKNAFSGQLYTEKLLKQTKGMRNREGYRHLNGYIPFVEFDFVTYYPASEGRWEEHYLGEKDGIFIMMLTKFASKTEGPKL